MLEAILRGSIHNRLFVLLATLLLAVYGVLQFTKLPIDAVPDITNVQVQINTSVSALSPLEIERQITFPIEWAMGGIPGVETVRSLSRYGLSQVSVVFDDGSDIYLARQLVNEKLQSARGQLPPGAAPEMGPVATGLGEIFMWSIENSGESTAPRRNITDLRTLQDWIVRPQFRTVRGVNEVNSIGGFEKIFQVAPDPARLISNGLSFRDVFDALAANNANAGGGYIAHHDEQYTIRSVGRVQSADDIGNIVVAAREGVPVFVKSIAEVIEGRDLRTGAATVDGEEAVIGTAIMLVGENSRVVSRRASDKVKEVAKTLPPGVKIRTLYDRTYLVDATLHTVRNNLFEGAVLVIVILFIMLGNLRAAVVTALAIPLSMLFAVTGMVRYKMSGNLMSLGAIDFGLIVDGAVIIVENCIRRLAERQHELGRILSAEEREGVIQEASLEVRKATMFGELIIMIVYLPILTLTGVEGKMFGPMAYTVIFALVGAMVLSLTFVPALCTYVLGGSISEKEVFLVRWAKALYSLLVSGLVRFPIAVVLFCIGVLGLSGVLATRLGSEFVPKLGEGALALQVSRLPSVSIETSVAMQKKTEQVIRKNFPNEVTEIFARTGTAEVATDPMGPNTSDTYIMLTPSEKWKNAHTQEELATAMTKALQIIPGQSFEVSQPIELRFNELISGVRSDVAVKVFGDKVEDMLAYANRVSGVLSKVAGAADVKVEQVTGLPMLTILINRQALARHGINVEDVQNLVEIALGGKEAGQIFEGDRRFDIVVRLTDRSRQNLDVIRNLPVPLPSGGEPDAPRPGTGTGGPPAAEESRRGYLPLSALAKIEMGEGHIGRTPPGAGEISTYEPPAKEAPRATDVSPDRRTPVDCGRNRRDAPGCGSSIWQPDTGPG